jgi:hypothetical protein
MDGENEFNSRVIVFGIIGIVFLILIFFPYQTLEKPAINKTANITRITTAPTPEIQYIYVTPTPDNGIYYAGEYTDGTRKLGRLFSWWQKDVDGLNDMIGHVKVYDYRIFNSVHIFDPTEYSYYEKFPTPGTKYLFIFVQIYLDDFKGSTVSKLWTPGEQHYFVTANGITYTPITWDKQVRIKEFEETANANDDFRMGYYGVFNAYSRSKEYVATAGEYAEPLYYIKPGKSNAIDGYIVYEIDQNITAQDILVTSNMFAFGNPSWVLKS